IALLDAARIPGKVEVEEVGAVRLKVQPLARGVGGEQDAQRVPGRVGIEAALDLLAAGAAGEPVDHLDTLVGSVRALDGLPENFLQVPLRAFSIFGKNQDAAVSPPGWLAPWPLAKWRKVRAEALPDPIDEAADLGIRQVAPLL